MSALQIKPLKILQGILVTLIFSSCGGGNVTPGSEDGPNSEVSYVVNVATDSTDTTIQLLRLTDDGVMQPNVEILDAVSLGYGAVDFISSSGSVPEDKEGLPIRCRLTGRLTMDDVVPCWGKPVLAIINSLADAWGVSFSEIVVTAQVLTPNSYQTSTDGAVIPPSGGESASSSRDFVLVFDAFVAEEGANSQVFDDEPPYE